MELKDLKVQNLDIKKVNVAEFVDTLYNQTKSSMLQLHRDWYVYERFVRGNHWILYNKTRNKIEIIPTSDGEVRRTVNKIRSQMRGWKNFIKRNQPRWEVHPTDLTDEAIQEAQKKNSLLQWCYDELGIKKLLTKAITSSYKYSVGIIEIGVVNINGVKSIDAWFDDAFDIFFDPSASSIDDCRFIIQTIKKPLSVVKEKYPKAKGLVADGETGSEFKKMLEKENYNRENISSVNDLDTILLKKIWILLFDGKKNTVRCITTGGGQTLETIDLNYSRYPFFIYNPEIDGNHIYSDPWVKDLISVNKSLNKTVSQIEAYTQRMLAGKYLIKQGVEVSTITDKGAEKIYYKGSVAPQHLDLQPMPQTPFLYGNNCERWIEEGGGVREASLGRTPGSLQSGKALEALQAADASVVAEPIENLELLLKEIAEFILELINNYQDKEQTAIIGNEKISFIGGEYEGQAPKGSLIIRPAKVTARIVPEIAYTEEAKIERMMQLANAQLIDGQTILEKLNVSNVSDVVQRVKKMKEEQYKQEIVKQRESHRTEGEGPQDTADLANQENLNMAAGNNVPMTPQALWTPEHTQLHMVFIQENQDAYQQNQELFDAHIQEEEQYNQ